MKNPIKSYNFWIKIIGAALLITFGVWLIVDISSGEKLATFIVLMFTGVVAGVFAVIRAVPLLRTLKTAKARLVTVVEIVVHLALSFVMIFGAISKITNNESQYATFVYVNYRFVIALYFYTRVLSYLICVILFKEETDKIKFWVHVGLMTLTSIFCAVQFEGKTIAWIIAVLALACSFGLIIDGGIGYNRYRKSIVKEREKIKEEQKQEQDSKDAPSNQEIIVPVDEQEKNESISVN